MGKRNHDPNGKGCKCGEPAVAWYTSDYVCQGCLDKQQARDREELRKASRAQRLAVYAEPYFCSLDCGEPKP